MGEIRVTIGHYVLRFTFYEKRLPKMQNNRHLHAGFAEVDITPPLGTHKIGWLIDYVAETVIDPLYARAAVFTCGDGQIAFIQLDTLSIRWTQVADIRRRIAARYGFPGSHVMVSATHNHAGPAVANVGDVRRDEVYIEAMVEKAVAAFGQAWARREEAAIGFASGFEFAVAHNRRVLLRDGTVRTHGTFDDPQALCQAGPIDPEVAVIAARSHRGDLLGILVNFACHPTHHGDGTALSAGWPGALAMTMKEKGCPATLFLNGAFGNMHTADPCSSGQNMPLAEAGARIAADVSRVLKGMSFREQVQLSARQATVNLPYRAITEDEIKGTVRGAQRFVDSAAYDRGMPALLRRIAERGEQPAEVQVLAIDEIALAGIPAEYFVEHGLRIKQEAHPRHALVVGAANGMVGYVPTRQAFVHGGYETTFAGSSRLAPEAGDILADTAIALIRQRP
jgi:hypothetical protein